MYWKTNTFFCNKSKWKPHAFLKCFFNFFFSADFRQTSKHVKPYFLECHSSEMHGFRGQRKRESCRQGISSFANNLRIKVSLVWPQCLQIYQKKKLFCIYLILWIQHFWTFRKCWIEYFHGIYIVDKKQSSSHWRDYKELIRLNF
jgi:hypothetical protein